MRTIMVIVSRRTLELTKDTTLSGGTHDGAILVCSQPITLTPAFVDMGSSFACTIVNLSCGRVTFAPGITTSNGFRTLPTGRLAELHAFTYSGGNVVFVEMEGGVTTLGPPGQVTGVTAAVTASSSVVLSWQAPTSGDTTSNYAVNYRQTSVGGVWTSLSAIGPSLTIGGLAAATMYDFQVLATNATGSGPASSIVSVATTS
jgi:hypothetical protein